MQNGVERVLRLASQRAGGPPLLAVRLKVRADDLAGWLRGQDAPPPATFLRAVDLLLAWSRRPLRDLTQDLRREASALL